MTLPLDRIHHDGSGVYVSDIAPQLGDTVRLRLRVPTELHPEHVVLRSLVDGEPRNVLARRERSDATEQWWIADLLIRNPLTHYRWLLAGGDVGYAWINAAGRFDHDVADAADFAIAAFPASPKWAQRAVVYQIFPDRFASSGRTYELPDWAVPRDWSQLPEGRSPNTSHEYFGGDLWGAIEQLDYLVDLGVGVVYFTPFFTAGSVHRYDASTFDHVDPLLGGNEALIAFVEAAHARGIKVLGDLTLNHSGDLHEWFVSAQAGDPSTRDFYSFDAQLPHGYECWCGVRTLPKFNYRSAELRRRLFEGEQSVLQKWLRAPFNLDGWRIDVAHMTGRQADVDLNHEVARLARGAVMKCGPDKVLVAEAFHDAGADLPGDGWQGTMNYAAFVRPVWAWLRADEFPGENWLGIPVEIPQFSGAQMVAGMRAVGAGVPWRSLIASWTILSSHDTARIRTVCGSRSRHIAAATMLMTMPGVPMIFSGDELGARGSWGEDSRTTHPWSDVADWDHEFLNDYRSLAVLRSQMPGLIDGGMRWVHVADDVIAYLRETATQRVLVVVARNPIGEISIPLQGFGVNAIEPLFGFTAVLEEHQLIVSAPHAGGGIWRIS